ncbi:MAG: hypothetical protein QOE66_2218 [Chloroflexota bacterium]|nr:hypothetical protein [Chloroflexota bacterium]
MATMTLSPLVTRVAGQASRRGLIPRIPSGDALLTTIETWLTAEYPDATRSSHRSQPEGGDPLLEVTLHPAAPAVIFTASDAGQVTVVGETEVVGPGYHRFVGRLLERMAIDLAITWNSPGSEGGDLDGTATTTFVDRPTAELAYLGSLGRTLSRVRSKRASGGAAIQLGISPGVRYAFDGAIATVLGPRDDAWLETALTDTRIATDITPWWADATDGQYLLNRALCLMWLEVRWRTPAMTHERLLLEEVHRLLSRAFPIDPGLAYPWRAWAELVELLGVDDAMARQATDRAAHAPEDVAPIGYRRRPVSISHEGWALEIPGDFAERRTHEEWWGGGAGRNITLAAVEAGTADGAMAAHAFVQQFAGDLGPDAIDHRAGGVMGRAKLSTDTSSGVEVGVLEGYSAVVGSGAAIRIVFDDPADWNWAVEMWRSLAPG